MKPRVLRYIWLVAVCLLAGTAFAQGQPQAAPRPWERDVPAGDKHVAEALFDQGVELHMRLLRDQAIARYEEALSHWDHPDIRWNLVLLMKDMGQYLRAWTHLEAALAWGPDAFDEHEQENLLAMQQMLLRQHLAVVEARCEQPGAEIALDGKLWFRGPGKARQVVLPGEHAITATKRGYFSMTRNVVLPAGGQGVITLSMSVDGVIEERRWQPWMPWAVFAAGMATGMVGAGLDWHAGRQVERARREFLDECDGALSCEPVTSGRALWEQRIGAGAMVVGGTVAAAGLALVLLNQPRAYRTENSDRGTFELGPILSPGAAGVSARFNF